MIINEKTAHPLDIAPTSRARIPLSARPLDLLYFSFFAIHIPASLLLDFQTLYPPSLVPATLSRLPHFYIQLSNDPFIGGLLGHFDAATAHSLVWFKTFLVLEALFQFPVFFLGMLGLYKGSRTIYILLLIYGASTATTTLPCITTLLATSSESLSDAQRLLLLSSYVPFFLIPLLMTFDMAARVAALVQRGIKAEGADKWK